MTQLPDTYDESYFTKKYEQKDGSDNFEVLNPKKTKVISEFVINRINGHISDKTILEIGCGYGILLKTFSHHFKSINGTDISEHAIKKVENKLEGNFVVNDIQQGPPFDEKFDAILAIDVLEHLSNIDDALEHLKHMMYSHSVMIVEIPLFTGSWYNKRVWKLIFDKDPTHVVRIDFSEFEKIMNRHGFVCSYRGTVLELPGVTKITKSKLAEKYTCQHFGEWKLKVKE